MKILKIEARKVLNSKAQPTIEIEIRTEKGTVKSSAPMGTSIGKYEAYQMKTDDAIRKFNVIKRLFISEYFKGQKDVDIFLRKVDKTIHFREIGGNLAIAISSAFLKAFSLEKNMEIWKYIEKEFGTIPKIPQPLCNIVGGWNGKNQFQEFLFLPTHQKSFTKSLFKISEAYNEISHILNENDSNFNYGKNIESAWVTSLNYKKILEIMKSISEKYMLKIGLDIAASQLYKNGYYNYGDEKINSHDQLSFIENVIKDFPITYIEDPFHEDDWLSFSTAVSRWRPKMVCGDDFYATRINRLLSSVEKKATNAVIVKPNQVGTISDSIEFCKEASKHNQTTILSHRSGETDDNIEAHIAVGLGCDYAKFGISGERIVRLNEIIRIEEEMNNFDSKSEKIHTMSKNLKEKINRI